LPVKEERLPKISFNVEHDRKGTFILDEERLVDVLSGKVSRRDGPRDHGERERQDAREPE